jgi:hypothetical protein
VQGAITFAFQVVSDGSARNVAAVENSTGSPDLAQCIAREISSWRVTAFSGGPQDFARTLRFAGVPPT